MKKLLLFTLLILFLSSGLVLGMRVISPYPIVSGGTSGSSFSGSYADLTDVPDFSVYNDTALISSAYVPYNGANQNVDLGTYNIEATKVGIGKTPTTQLDINAVNNVPFLKASDSLTSTTYMSIELRGGGINAIPRLKFLPDGYGYLDIWQSHPYYAFLVHDSSGWGGFGIDAVGTVRLSSSATDHDVQILTGNYGTINAEFKGGGNVELNYNLSVEDNIGIGTTTPSYPLEVNAEVGGISVYALGNISATGYNTRTSVYDKDQGLALDKVKDSDYYLKSNGKIDHSKFYGYTGEITTIDYDKPVWINKTVKDHNKTYEVLNEETGEIEVIYPYNTTVLELTYPFTKEEGQVSLNMEIDLLRQAIYELSEKNKELKLEVEILKLK